MLAAGCGGGGSAVTVDKKSGAYQGGFDVCSATPLAQHAQELGVEATREAVAAHIGESIAGSRGGPDYEAGRQGCLDAYAAAK